MGHSSIWVMELAKLGSRDSHTRVTPDGKFVYYAKTPSDPDIWRVPSSGGEESAVFSKIHVHLWKDWALVDKGIFFVPERSVPNSALKFFDFSTGRIRTVATIEKPGEWISASADGKFVLYHQFDELESGIMLLENFW
jgi:hypothetical protein